MDGGEAERDGEVGDESGREDAVGAAADLIQGLFGGWGHHPIRRRGPCLSRQPDAVRHRRGLDAAADAELLGQDPRQCTLAVFSLMYSRSPISRS